MSGKSQPQLADELPQLNTPTWVVHPDGRMETTYRLRPNLTWHDGAALTAEDFIFSWNVYATPELGQTTSPAISQIEQVRAPDTRTLQIHWRQPYADAGILDTSFPPLPRHILGESFAQSAPDLFVAHPLWAREHVGLGPYQVDQWESGAFLEATAFGGFVFGRPRIERLRVLFIGDPNTVLANLLAGEVHLAIEDSIRFQQGSILKREWAGSGAGAVTFSPSQWRFIQIQLRPELASPRAIMDVPVRRALAHAVDKQALSDALFEGEGVLAETMIPPTADYYPTLLRAISTYSYEPRRAEALMEEAGFPRGRDGFFQAPDGRLMPEIKTIAASQNEAEMSVLASGWRQAGFDAQEAVISPSQAQDSQTRATFRTMHLNGGPLGEKAVAGQLITARIPKPENRWTGSNRGAWSNLEYDRRAEAIDITLNRAERTRHVIEAVRIYSEDLPAISLYFQLTVVANAAALVGIREATPEGSVAWNIHEWELR